jgi:peptidyl-prolyl cis-trans isomerase C
MRIFQVSLMICLVGLVGSCDRPADSKAKSDQADLGAIIARVGDATITVAEFQKEWQRRSGLMTAPPPTSEQGERLLDELVRAKAVLAKARAAGLEQDPETVRLVERLLVARFTEAEFARRFGAALEISETEIAAFYESNIGRFQDAPAIRAGFLFLKLSPKADAEARAARLELARELHARATHADANAFSALVQKYSEDQATRYRGGDTGWLQADPAAEGESAVGQAAFQLREVGEVAPLVIASNGCYIVRLLEQRPSRVHPLPEVREAIRYELQQRKRAQREQEFFAKMRQGLKIEINQAALKAASTALGSSHPPPPPVPGG